MKDYIVRGMSMDGFVKAVGIRSTELVRRGAQIQKTAPNATAAFGRALTAGSIMGNMQKTEDSSLTLQIRGGGPIGTITVVSDAVGNVRGCVTEPRVPLVEKYPGKLDVGATVGTNGTLTVIRDLQMKEPFVGSVPLVSGEIADDVTAYFAQSEQIPTVCSLGVLVDVDRTCKAAGGILIQLLPFADEETVDKIEKNVPLLSNISALFDAGMTNEAIIDRAMSGIEYDIFDDFTAEYICSCSRERILGAISSFSEKELDETFADLEKIEVCCHFCDKKYYFTRDEVEAYKKIREEKKNG